MAVAVALPVVALPVIAVLMILAAVSGGSPIFGHPHTGHGRRTFRCPEIRTMVADARLGKLLAEEPIPAIDRFLRQASLDGLPRLWSALRGDMSIADRRSTTMRETQLHDVSAHSCGQARPGCTGMWQVSGSRQGRLCRAGRVRSRPCREPSFRPGHLDRAVDHAHGSAGYRALNRLVA